MPNVLLFGQDYIWIFRNPKNFVLISFPNFQKSQKNGVAGKVFHLIVLTELALNIYNPGQNILIKIEKSSKTGQGKKSLKSTFAPFLTAIVKV